MEREIALIDVNRTQFQTIFSKHANSSHHQIGALALERVYRTMGILPVTLT